MNSLVIQRTGSEERGGGDHRIRRPVGTMGKPRQGLVTRPSSAILHRIRPVREMVVRREPPPPNYRDAACDLCEKTVSLALDIPLAALRAKTRQSPDVALARQIAMYLSHTMFGIAFSEVGLHFRRDRTTVSHACALIEDKRDDLSFDVTLCQLEALLSDALDMVQCPTRSADAGGCCR